VDPASPYPYGEYIPQISGYFETDLACITDEGEVLDMFARLPMFMALESVTLGVRPPCKAEGVIGRLKGAPILTTLFDSTCTTETRRKTASILMK
jgi:hypothetical protein